MSEVDPARLIAANREAVRLYRGLLIDPCAGWPRAHLTERGLGHLLDPDSRWQVGYAPASFDLVVEHLQRRGFEDAEIKASGLATQTHRGRLIDRFRDRIVVPVLDPEGRPIGLIGRANGRAARAPKYLNSPGTPIYRKGEVLFGLAEQRDHFEAGAVPVLVEGPMDVLAVDATKGPARAIRAAVAICGTALTAEQVRLLRASVSGDTVLLMTDTDAPGRKAAERAFDLLSPHFRTVLTPDLPDGSDPADVLRTHGPAGLRAALGHTVPAVRRIIELRVGMWERWFDHAAGQLNAVTAVADLVRRLPPRDIAAEIAWLADRVGLPPDLVTQAVVESNALERSRTAAARRRTPGRREESCQSAGRTSARELGV